MSFKLKLFHEFDSLINNKIVLIFGLSFNESLSSSPRFFVFC